MYQKVSAWAQVQPITAKTRQVNCEFCLEVEVVWQINGRSGALTRTETVYTCRKCLDLGLTALRWE